jgi:hypothetical protein
VVRPALYGVLEGLRAGLLSLDEGLISSGLTRREGLLLVEVEDLSEGDEVAGLLLRAIATLRLLKESVDPREGLLGLLALELKLGEATADRGVLMA